MKAKSDFTVKLMMMKEKIRIFQKYFKGKKPYFLKSSVERSSSKIVASSPLCKRHSFIDKALDTNLISFKAKKQKKKIEPLKTLDSEIKAHVVRQFPHSL